jgi:putative phage-type endonuclease
VVAEAVPAYGTPEWVAWRRGGLGASDLPAILGLDPYRSEHDVWEEKTGRRPAFSGNARTRWGHRLEALGLQVWEEADPDHREVDPNDAPKTALEWPHLWATPDGIGYVREVGRVGIEVKVTAAWVTPPERVKVQCLAQAGICDLDRVDVVRLSFEDDPAIFRIEREEAAIENILASGEAWYVKHVLGGIEPPRREGEVEADERQAQLAADLRRVKQAMAALEKQERAIRDDLIASVAGRGVITGPGFRIEVRAAHDTTRTSWKELASGLLKDMAEEEREALIGLHQTTSRTGPAVYPTWEEE